MCNESKDWAAICLAIAEAGILTILCAHPHFLSQTSVSYA